MKTFKLLDPFVFVGTFLALFIGGAGWRALLIIPYALWNYLGGLLQR